MNVARLANIPVSIIKKAKIVSQDIQKEMEKRRLKKKQIMFLRAIFSSKAPTQKDFCTF